MSREEQIGILAEELNISPQALRQAIADLDVPGHATRTIEPVAEPAPPGIPIALSQASHAGLALTTGDLLQRVMGLESRVFDLEAKLYVEPPRPVHIEHEPEPQGPMEDTDLEVVGDVHEIEGSAAALTEVPAPPPEDDAA